jgi:hypothetical protein
MSTVARRGEWADAGAIRIAHDIPGRLRVKLPPGPSADPAGALERLNGVHSAVWSPRTRSLLIRYDPSLVTSAEITRTIAEETDLEEPVSSSRSESQDERRPVARAVLDVFNTLNERVGRRTRGRLNLGLLVATGLVLWSGRQLLRGPVTSLSWTSALWYAHGLFRDYAARER